MRCRESRRRISEAIDGRLEGPVAEAFDAHLSKCRSCRAERDRLDRVRAVLERLPRPAALPGFASRVLSGVLEDRSAAAAPRVARPSPTPWPELAYRAAVVGLLVTLNATMLLSDRGRSPEADATPARAASPAAVPTVEPVVQRVDRYRDFFKTVDILAGEPAEVRPVLARHAALLNVEPPTDPAVRRDEEVARFFEESAEVVADLRDWTRHEGPGGAPDPRLAGIRARARELVRRSQDLRGRLVAIREGLSIPDGAVPGPEVFQIYARGSTHYFAGDYEPAKRYFLRLEHEAQEGPLADSARYLLFQCLQRTGEVDRAAPILLALRKRGVVSAEEFPEIAGRLELAPGPHRFEIALPSPDRGSRNVRFVRVSFDGREMPLRHGESFRTFIRGLRDGESGDYLVRHWTAGGERRVQETMRLEDGPEVSIEYVSGD